MPNIPPAIVGAELVEGAGGLFPNRLPADGVVELAPPNRPGPEEAGVVEVLVEDGAPPKSPPAGLVLLPNKEVAVPVGVLLPPAAAPALPNENEGVPAPEPAPVPVAGALPNRPPEAGADVVVLLEAAPDELGAPKVNDMMVERVVQASSMRRLTVRRSQRFYRQNLERRIKSVNPTPRMSRDSYSPDGICDEAGVVNGWMFCNRMLRSFNVVGAFFDVAPWTSSTRVGPGAQAPFLTGCPGGRSLTKGTYLPCTPGMS